MTKEANILLRIDNDIVQTLNEISLDDSEKLKLFREIIFEYCNNEKAAFYIFRILKEIELELNDCLNGLIHINVDRLVIIKVLRLIRVELDIIRTRIKNLKSIESSETKAPKPAGQWTDDKLNLIELIYAIYKTKSVNGGNTTLREIQECFEYLFQVKLGNISNRINEIDNKKGHDKLYLDILIKNLNNYLDEINA